jgi:glyoxylase-like metal-dependent hydrolase (beta-lactamase superfamily II)
MCGTERVVIIDPGPADADHIARLLALVDGRPVDAVFVTHTHGDHSPAAALLLQHFDAPVVGLPVPLGSGQDPSFMPSRQYHDNEKIRCGDFFMKLLHTPGHVSNHMCFLLEPDGMLFTGDHILEGTTPVILPPYGNMSHYLISLKRLKHETLRFLAPAHGRVMTQPYKEIDKLIRHRMHREAKVRRVLASAIATGPLTLEALNLQVYDDVASHLLPWAEKTLTAHLIKLEDDGEVEQSEAGWTLRDAQAL